jgi:hypothetical protein
MQCPSIKSPPLCYGSGFFFKGKYYYAFIARNAKKHIFSMEFHSKTNYF